METGRDMGMDRRMIDTPLEDFKIERKRRVGFHVA